MFQPEGTGGVTGANHVGGFDSILFIHTTWPDLQLMTGGHELLTGSHVSINRSITERRVGGCSQPSPHRFSTLGIK